MGHKVPRLKRGTPKREERRGPRAGRGSRARCVLGRPRLLLGRRMKMRASANNKSRDMFRAIMTGVASAAVRRFNKKNNTLAEQSKVRGLEGMEVRLGILTEFTWSGVSGCRAWMDGAERMDAKLAEVAADDCEAGVGGKREPPGAAPDRTLGFAFSALICCRTAFR